MPFIKGVSCSLRCSGSRTSPFHSKKSSQCKEHGIDVDADGDTVSSYAETTPGCLGIEIKVCDKSLHYLVARITIDGTLRVERLISLSHLHDLEPPPNEPQNLGCFDSSQFFEEGPDDVGRWFSQKWVLKKTVPAWFRTPGWNTPQNDKYGTILVEVLRAHNVVEMSEGGINHEIKTKKMDWDEPNVPWEMFLSKGWSQAVVHAGAAKVMGDEVAKWAVKYGMKRSFDYVDEGVDENGVKKPWVTFLFRYGDKEKAPRPPITTTPTLSSPFYSQPTIPKPTAPLVKQEQETSPAPSTSPSVVFSDAFDFTTKAGRDAALHQIVLVKRHVDEAEAGPDPKRHRLQEPHAIAQMKARHAKAAQSRRRQMETLVQGQQRKLAEFQKFTGVVREAETKHRREEESEEAELRTLQAREEGFGTSSPLPTMSNWSFGSVPERDLSEQLTPDATVNMPYESYITKELEEAESESATLQGNSSQHGSRNTSTPLPTMSNWSFSSVSGPDFNGRLTTNASINKLHESHFTKELKERCRTTYVDSASTRLLTTAAVPDLSGDRESHVDGADDTEDEEL